MAERSDIRGYTKPTRDEIVRIIADTLERATRAGVTERFALADMILRELRASRVRLVIDGFED
jgi:hypothetical protein